MRTHFRIPILTVLATAVLILPISSRAQSQPEDKLQRSFTVKPGSTLRVENYKGTIHINASDTNQVSVTALKRFSGSESDRKEWMENTKVDFESSGDRVDVRVSYPSQNQICAMCWQGHDYVAEVDLEIQVPRHINIDADGYKPDIRIASVQGDVRIKSYKAPITIESTSGRISIDTYKDMLKLRNVAVHGGLDVTSYKADLTVEARAVDGPVHLETNKGNIVLRVPPDLGFSLDFSSSRRGTFHSDFPVTTETGGLSHAALRGTFAVQAEINHGGPKVVVRTERGSVSLEKLVGDL